MRSSTQTELLARKHLERRLAPLRKASELARPPRGWIKAIRYALGMTSAQLGRRIKVAQSRIIRIEKDEVAEAITLKTLRRIAEGLNCTLVYALVPNEPLDEILRTRARAVTEKRLAHVHQTMKLENQALDDRDLQAEREWLVNELMTGDPRRLWNES
jgi:predicted DNA-binding mobile mystery protein A